MSWNLLFVKSYTSKAFKLQTSKSPFWNGSIIRRAIIQILTLLHLVKEET